jgi:hypothetical protein
MWKTNFEISCIGTFNMDLKTDMDCDTNMDMDYVESAKVD